jgi:hypothetical protein
MAIAAAGCGKRGAPLAPLNLIPEPPSAVTGKRMSGTVYLQMLAPRKNANGPGTLEIDHLEVYAVTVHPGLLVPANRDLFLPEYLVGQIAIKPPPDEEASTEQNEADTRPGPGEPVTFTEELTEKQLQASPGLRPAPPPVANAPAQTATPSTTEAPGAPATGAPPTDEPAATAPTSPLPTSPPDTVIPPPTQLPPAATTPPPQTPPAAQVPTPAETPGAAPPPAAGAPGAPPPAQTPAAAAAAAAAAARPASPSIPVRVYAIRGVTKKGRPGPPSGRVTIPLVPPPPAPGTLSVSFNEQAVLVSWLAPVAPSADAPALAFNVYSAPVGTEAQPQPANARPSTPAPMNPAPLAGPPFEHPGATPGTTQCFTVRTVQKVVDISVESDPTPPICVTVRDIFPPAPPKGLAVVAMDGGVMNLIWDANTEPDLGGYVVLRGQAPGDTLQPLTPEPIHDTSYRDTTATPGVRYVYAIVAVDRATPPNRSQPSARVEETAR